MKETFFLQVAPGFEKLAKLEFDLKFPGLFPSIPLPEGVIEKGGLTLELPLETGLTLNYWLKVPNRILLRLAHFKCRDLPKLFNKVSKLNLSPYYAGQSFNIKVSSHSSRLFDDRKIKKTLTEALERNQRMQEPKKAAKERVLRYGEWKLLCRFEEDWCTLSLDTSGERLGIRGYKSHVGRAPLRENLAASLYLFSALPSEKDHLNEDVDLLTPYTLIDPFAGGGTFLMEAALFYEPNLFRNYAFEFLPHFETSKNKESLRPPALNLDLPLFLIGSDLSSSQLEALERNFKTSGLSQEDFALLQGDALSKEFAHQMANQGFSRGPGRTWCLTNPPYGKRVKDPKNLFTQKNILESLGSWGSWERLGVLLPYEEKVPEVKGLEFLRRLRFSHGGEDVAFCLYRSVL